ncbi:MAG: polyhydroxyalkanoate synthesis regulator DNA-binding domain-containing protein, partial [Pseudoxanthomonas sp.]|nr:polyhydroxyalkanoate synthesis regulator DNA-binding domain-containing protein [Pseudoxanthomonas sp.]
MKSARERPMAATRIIKKYPNRRLYDTEISSYITIEDVRQLILDGESFEVRDAKSGEDLTRSVLLQIIAEQDLHRHATALAVGRRH